MRDFTLKWDGHKVSQKVASAAEDALLAGAQLILKEAQSRVPVDTGKLRDSGKAEAEGDQATVSFSTGYAVPVHENLEAHHNNGEAKYLEKALAAKKREALEAIAAELRKALR